MNSRLRGAMFDALKSALKARGWTYADLADRLDLSEPTIKRLFAEGDCKLGRILEICDLLDLSLSDLTERARRSTDTYLELSEYAETELAKNPQLFDLYVLLQNGDTPERVAEQHKIAPHQLHSDLQKLHRFGLAVLKDDGTFSVRTDRPLRLQRHGPLHARIREINLQFFTKVYDSPDSDDQLFRTMSRRMLPDSARILRQEITELLVRMDKLARQDRLISAAESLATWKFSTAFGSADFADILGLESERTKHSAVEQPGRTAL